MKDITDEAKATRPNSVGRDTLMQEGASAAPPGYGIDFLDKRAQSASPPDRPERLLAHELQHIAEQRPGTNPEETSLRPTPDGDRSGSGKADGLGKPHPAMQSLATPPQMHGAKAVEEKMAGQTSRPATSPMPKPEVAAVGPYKEGTGIAKEPDNPPKLSSPPVQARTIPDKPLVSPKSQPPPMNEGRGAIDFLAANKPQPAPAIEVKSQAGEKPPFSLPKQPVVGKESPVSAKAKPEGGPDKGTVKPPKAVEKTAMAAAQAPMQAAEAAPPSPVGQSAEHAPDAVPVQGHGAEALAEDRPKTNEEEKTQERLDSASPETPTPSESAEASESTASGQDGGAESAGAAEAAEEQQALPEAAEPPVAGGEMSAAPPPPGDEGAQAQALESNQDAQARRMEQEDKDHAEQQRAEDQEEERAEAQPVAAQAEAAPQGGAESAELAPAEKSAALASVSEDVGGAEAVPSGGGGGGGGAAPPPEPEAPDTASMDPEAGLAASANLPVGAAVKALGGVGSSVDNSIQQEGERLQGEMPEVEVGGEGGGTAVKPLNATGGPGKTPRSQAQGAKPTEATKPLPEPPPSPVRKIQAPALAPAADGSLSAADAQRVQASIQALPTTDPGMDVAAGPPPQLKLSGDADPAQVADQKQKLQASIQAQRAQGAAEAAAPAGEDDLRVRRPKEALKPKALAMPAGGGGAVEAPEEAIAIIAEEKKGGEVRAAISQAQGELVAKRSEHQGKVAEEKNKSNQQMVALQKENADQQNEARKQAKAEVEKARADWSEEQRKEVDKADEKTQAELAKGDEKIAHEQQQADAQAAKHIADGEGQGQRHKRDAESDAERKKKDAENESKGGVFEWLSSKVTAFFDKLKQGLTAIFDAAKKLIHAAIEQAKKLAVAVIEKARAAVVSIIRAVGDALIAIGDALLAAFPGLRAKWRAFIESKVKAAEDLVNRLADVLKRGVQKLLDFLGKGLEALLDLYKKGMLAALDAAKSAAMGAIKFAKSVADTLGAFVAIVKDIAQNPGQWLSNLGAAIKDGIKNHLWKAFSSAVKNWFNEKIEEVVGIGTAIWNVLKKGGIALKEIGSMVWQALKQAIPSALISLLIEKLVAMIVPAAGAVMAIIEGVKAAWGSIQRIIAAISKFVEFLKAVKQGGAGPQFASMLAAAAIVVIDFVANWLLRKLRGPASKVSGKIKAVAKKIMDKIKALAKRVGRWLKGKFKGLAAKLKGWKKKFDDWREKRKGKKKDPNRKKEERIKRAERELPGKIKQFLAKKPGRLRLFAQLMAWRFQYHLSSLKIKGSASQYRIEGKINPTLDLAPGWSFEHKELFAAVDRIALRMLDEANKEKASQEEETEQGKPIDLRERQEPGKGVVSLAPESEFITGETVGGVKIGHSHKKQHAPQPGPPSANWQGIAALGEEGKGHWYGDIGKGLQNQPTGELMAKILRREKVPDLSEQQIKLLGEMHGLWFAKEPSHSKGKHRRDLVYGLMVTELMTEGSGGKALTTRQGISLHPASFGGAQAGAQRVTREMEGKPGWLGTPKTESARERRKKIDKATRKRKGRELGTIKLWFRRHASNLPQLDRPATIADVEAFVESKIREFLRQHE